MRSLIEIRLEIEGAAARRTELAQALSETHDPARAAERRRLDQALERLWDEYRQARVAVRFGDREQIIARARQDERLERAA